jgi:histidine triad (HIT) family protein
MPEPSEELDACAFCAIVAGRASAMIVREWDDAVAIVPLNPVVNGHVLVLPKRHVETFFSDPEISAATMRRAAEMLHGVERHFEPRDHNVITSAGRAATQTVMHMHVHIVPRRYGDGLPLPWTPQQAALTPSKDTP